MTTEGLENVKVSIDLHQNSITGHYIPRIMQDCVCGEWGITMSLASWSNLATVTESARLHIRDCKGDPRG